MTITRDLLIGPASAHGPRCDRCRAEAELGECPFCHRLLCVECYDSDQDGYCHPAPLVERDEAIRALRGSLSAEEIAARFGLSRRTIWRVTK